MKTKQMTLNSVLAAMVAVLAFMAINLGNMKITIESIPVLIAALLFGPWHGAGVAALGTSVYQLLRFGVTATTPLWILPYVVYGLFIGYFAKKKNYTLSKAECIVLVLIGEIVITLINTGALYLDSKIYGYYYPTIIVGMIIPRLLLAVAKGIIYAIAVPPIVDRIRKATL